MLPSIYVWFTEGFEIRGLQSAYNLLEELS
jgi:hypothetical protein